MKRFVSAWNMRSKNAFTLIEVMIAVMIISVVIMSLLEMHGNTTHIFSKLKNKLQINQYTSFFIANRNYGFEKDSVHLDDLLSDFNMEDDLRRELKKVKVEITYEELDQFDFSDNDSEDNEIQSSSEMSLEIGKTFLKVNDSSASLVRLRIQ